MLEEFVERKLQSLVTNLFIAILATTQSLENVSGGTDEEATVDIAKE